MYVNTQKYNFYLLYLELKQILRSLQELIRSHDHLSWQDFLKTHKPTGALKLEQYQEKGWQDIRAHIVMHMVIVVFRNDNTEVEDLPAKRQRLQGKRTTNKTE